jgi:putative transposase
MLQQRMSQWGYGKDIEYLDYKSFELQRVGTGNEFPLWGMRPSAQTSRPEPVSKACGLSGPRDLFGSINMHPIAFESKATFPYRKMSRIQGPVLVGST